MNELLIRHGCSTVFSLPPGLKELMSDISREVLREQPAEIYDFITNYLSALLVTREHGVLSVKILEDLCDCKPSLVEHFDQFGVNFEKPEEIAKVVQFNIEAFEPTIGNEKFVEAEILRKVLKEFKEIPSDETIAKFLQIIRNEYKDYWYRKNLMSKHILQTTPQESWEKAVEYTLNVYKKTKPTLAQLHQATLKIQTAYRGYYIRRDMASRPQLGLPNKVDMRILDIADSREIDLGPYLKMMPKDDASKAMMEAHRQNVKYDPLHSIDYRPDKPNAEVTIMKTGSEELYLDSRTSVSDEKFEERDKNSVDFPDDYEDSHKKITFALKMKLDEEENKAAQEETIDDIAIGVVHDVVEAIPRQEHISEDITVKPDQEAENSHEIAEEIVEQIHEAGTDEGAEAISKYSIEAVSEPVAENVPEGAQGSAFDDSLGHNDPTVEIGKKQPQDQAWVDQHDPTSDYAELKSMEVQDVDLDMEDNKVHR